MKIKKFKFFFLLVCIIQLFYIFYFRSGFKYEIIKNPFNENSGINYALSSEVIESNDILKKLATNEVPSAPILNREQLLDNEQVIENKIIEFHDSKFYGKIRSPRPAPIYSNSPINGKQLAPLLGENSREILKEINYSNEDIKEIKETAKNLNAKIITTEKDYNRLNKFNAEGIEFLNVELKVLNEKQLINFLNKKL